MSKKPKLSFTNYDLGIIYKVLNDLPKHITVKKIANRDYRLFDGNKPYRSSARIEMDDR